MSQVKRTQLTQCLAALSVSFAMIAVGATALRAETYTMKMASATIHDVQHEWQKVFKSGVEARAGDRLTIEIYPASQLGSIPRMLEGVLLGTIESFITPTSFVVGTERKFEIFDAPGLFENPEQVERVIHDPPFRARVFEYGRDKGFRTIAIIFNSPIVVLSRTPIRTLAEFKGQKIRTFASPMQTEPMKALGASPVPLPLTEVIPALQSGNIDGLLAGMPILTAFKFYDVAKAVTATHSSVVISINIVSSDWFDGLPGELQQIILEEAKKAAVAVFPWGVANVERSNQAWLSNGGEIFDLSPEDQARMMDEMAAAGAKVLSANPAVETEYQALLEVIEVNR